MGVSRRDFLLGASCGAFGVAGAWAWKGNRVIIQSMPYPLAVFVTPTPTTYDNFVENGSNKPFYSSATFPAAFYDASNDRTWVAYEGYGTGRRAMVTYYDHTAEEYGPTVAAGTIDLVDDSHGMPAICRDHQGYIHAFFGPHPGNFKWSVTTSADDNSAWTSQSDITGEYTYPNPVPVGSSIYLFARKTTVDDTGSPLILRIISSLSGGSGTVGSEIILADPEDGGDERFYVGPVYLVGSKVHMVGTISNQANSDRSGVYYLIYDTSTGSLSNWDESTTTTSGSLPIDKTLLDSDYRIATTATTGTQHGFAFDENGDSHVVYLDGSGSSYDVKHIENSSGSWSSATTVTTTDGSEVPISLIKDSVGLQLWISDDPTSSWTNGGNMTRYRYNGSWGSKQTIRAADGRALFHPTAVLNGTAEARIMFDEVAQTDTNGDAGNRVFLFGDDGFLQRFVQDAATDTLLAAFSTTPSEARKRDYDRLIIDLKATGIWAKLDGLWIFAAHDADDALINIRNPGTHDATLIGAPTFAADDYYSTDGTDDQINLNFNPATAGGNFTQNDAMMGIFMANTSASTGSMAGYYDGADGVTLRPYPTWAARINSASSYAAGSTPNGIGNHTAQRTSSTSVQNYRNGALFGTAGTMTSTALNSANLLLGGVGASSFVPAQFRAAWVGGSLTATQHRHLHDILTAYLEAAEAL